MKLLYLMDTLYKAGGMEHILTEKANVLSRDYGYEVLVVTNHQKGRPLFFPLDASVQHIDLDVNYRLPWNMPRYVRRLSALMEKERPDVLISLCMKDLPILSRLPKTGVQMAEFHFCRETFRIKGQENRLRKMEEAVRGLDCFVALTREDAALWKPYCKRVEQIYNPSFMPVSDGTGASVQARRCISAGRFEPQKDFSQLVAVWKRVHAKHPDWTLAIFGNGKQKKAVARLIRKEGLEQSIHLYPATRELHREMQRSSLFLMTSRYEGFPLVMIEAASLGLPFLSYACPCGPGEFIENGVDGFTVAPGDVQGLADRICDCMEHSELLEAMSRNIQRKAAAFTVPVIMRQWDALFRSLVTGPQPQGPGYPGSPEDRP